MRKYPTISSAMQRIIFWIICHTTHRHLVTASWELNDEYDNRTAIRAWIRSAPDGHIYWIDQPNYQQYETGDPWITRYNWAFRRREDALLHQLRCPR